MRGIWEIAEFEIYGAGFAPQAGYNSNIIDLGGAASLGSLSWSGQQDPGARIELAMRSGDDDDPHTYWRYTFRGNETSRFDDSGKPLTLQSYQKLESGEKAEITYDTKNWTGWSTAYDFEAGREKLVADKPRRFVQFKADFRSTQETSGRLEYLAFAVSIPPVATEALAEIVPVITRAGEVTRFTYKLLPRLRLDDLGFDSIAIDTPARPVSVDAVRVSGMDVDFTVTRLDEEGFEVQLPRLDAQRTEELIEVVFQAEVFQYGTVFTGQIFDSTRIHELHQQVTAGDADELVDSNTLSVGLSDILQETIQALRLFPKVFTPNGDGANDGVRIEYDLLNLVGAVPVVVGVYDLSGRQRVEAYRGEVSSGRFSTMWDGRDAQGNVLPPGIYILRLDVEADKGRQTSEQIISLAY